ncbi:MAG: Na+/H+ antiporter NhaA, partial [Acidimicrobiia bacterium]|nr:Na+/H+ antiporter NhaA [Acidimicrobiia bacterium]
MLRFAETEAASGIVLLLAAAAAIIWANAPFGETYEKFWHTHFSLEIGSVFHFD